MDCIDWGWWYCVLSYWLVVIIGGFWCGDVCWWCICVSGDWVVEFCCCGEWCMFVWYWWIEFVGGVEKCVIVDVSDFDYWVWWCWYGGESIVLRCVWFYWEVILIGVFC